MQYNFDVQYTGNKQTVTALQSGGDDNEHLS